MCITRRDLSQSLYVSWIGDSCYNDGHILQGASTALILEIRNIGTRWSMLMGPDYSHTAFSYDKQEALETF